MLGPRSAGVPLRWVYMLELQNFFGTPKDELSIKKLASFDLPVNMVSKASNIQNRDPGSV